MQKKDTRFGVKMMHPRFCCYSTIGTGIAQYNAQVEHILHRNKNNNSERWRS